MSGNVPISGNLRLRLGSADVLEWADTRANVVAQSARDDPFAVLGTDDRAKRAARPPGGWRGLLQLVRLSRLTYVAPTLLTAV